MASSNQDVDDIIVAYLKAVDAGQAPTPADLLAGHPEHATELREFLRDQEFLGPLCAPFETPVSVAPPPVVPGYEIGNELGAGGMGVVYEARQIKANRPVALKMIRSAKLAGADERARFIVEAQAVAQLNHANIVKVFDVGE